jgi:hypothetical protein
MKQAQLRELTSEQLVELFAKIALQQDDALLSNEVEIFNKLFEQMNSVERELKSRPGDHRNMLLRLYDHPNAQVRVKAAKRTLAVAPEAARSILETIASSRKFPQAGEAGMSLEHLDRGIFKPK